MRFIQGTPDIPDDLIKDVAEGHALFVCGAGVSMRVGMPSFGALTHQIYAYIGETPKNEGVTPVLHSEDGKRQEPKGRLSDVYLVSTSCRGTSSGFETNKRSWNETFEVQTNNGWLSRWDMREGKTK